MKWMNNHYLATIENAIEVRRNHGDTNGASEECSKAQQALVYEAGRNTTTPF